MSEAEGAVDAVCDVSPSDGGEDGGGAGGLVICTTGVDTATVLY